ncbi:MAG TPA: hypothetical protein VFH51_09620, partial [Myxococcota bacterium]|nr:hypothetical protein [Myxococcota bacterium]
KGSGMPGVHRREGIFLATGPGLPATDLPALHIAEAGALVYPLAGVPTPNDLPVAAPAYLTDLLAAASTHAPTPTLSTLDPYNAHEALQVTQRLQALGYLE